MTLVIIACPTDPNPLHGPCPGTWAVDVEEDSDGDASIPYGTRAYLAYFYDPDSNTSSEACIHNESDLTTPTAEQRYADRVYEAYYAEPDPPDYMMR